MDATREVAFLDVAKKKSKKRKSRESSDNAGEDSTLQEGDKGDKKKGTGFLGDTRASKAVADAVSSVDVDNNSRRRKKKKKDISRKEEKEKDINGDMKDKGSDHKGEKKKKSQTGDYGGVLEESQMMEPKRKDKSDFELAKEKNERAREEGEVKKKKHKSKKEHKRKELVYAGENDGVGHDGSVENQVGNEVTENVEPVPDKKRKKKKGEKDLGVDLVHDSDVHSINREEGRVDSGSKKKKERSRSSNTEGDVNTENQMDNEVTKRVHSKEDKKTKKKKKDKGAGCTPTNEENSRGGGSKKKKGKPNGSNNTEKDADAGASKTKKRKRATKTSEKSTSRKKSKRVRFSDQDEVFSLPDNDSSKGEKAQEARHTSADGLVRGKRFSEEEDEIVKNAVLDYIESHQLGEEGIQMVMKCSNHPEIRDCWKVIGESLPWRPYSSVYYRAHILFERGEKRKWSEEELELVRKYHEEHGANWKQLADELGKHRIHVKDAWRRIKLPNRKNGHWSQEEYQSLFDLVNVDLSLKLFEEKKSKHGMLRDNISWEAISGKLTTRSVPICCMKWYQQLTSPLVAEGKWADADDYRLLIALVEVDAPCEDEVDWDNLLEHRSGEICRKRWSQMVRHIGEPGVKQFNEQVDILSKRYCADLLEARETFDNKPYVD